MSCVSILSLLITGICVTLQIRITDGLLQRWVKQAFRQSKQGYLQQYWFEGNNYSFVHLLYLVKKAEIFRATVSTIRDDDSATSEAREALSFLDKAEAFHKSFEDVKDQLWEMIALPYESKKASKDDMDFIDNGFEETGNDYSFIRESEMDRLKQEMEKDKELTRILELKYANQLEPHYSDDEPDQNSESSEEGQGEEVNIDDSEQSEEDEWLASKMKRRKASSRLKGEEPTQRRSSQIQNGETSKPDSKITDSDEDLGKVGALEDSSVDNEFETVIKSTVGLTRRAIQDSSDDEA
jgi:hypothetical protein